MAATVPRSGSGWLRKRPSFNQPTGSFHNLQQDHRYQPNEEHPTTPSKCSGGEPSSKRPQKVPLHTLLPSLSLPMCSPSDASGSGDNGNYLPPVQRAHSTNDNRPMALLRGSTCHRKISRYQAFGQRLEAAFAKIRNWNDVAMKQSPRYERLFNKTTPYLRIFFNLLREIVMELISIKCTCRQKLACIFIIAISYSNYIYFIKMPVWRAEEEWARWEEGMQRSVAALIPPLPTDDHDTSHNNYWRTNDKQLEQFPYLSEREANAYAVPVPDYELMGRTRGELARHLRMHATQSCQNYRRYHNSPNQMHSLPAIGITVATDTPDNRYLRRLLHTIDLATVGSIVVTWYDEQTEAQLVGKERVSLSHEVIAEALSEFITLKGFTPISWENATNVEGSTSLGADPDRSIDDENDNKMQQPRGTQLADTASLKLLSRIATSVDQFCIFDNDQSQGQQPICRNELVILRFPTNLGCSSGVNNALFTHPTSPHWLITNYDIAYPPGVLDSMGKELHEARMQNPDLAVLTYGFIYGRGKLENPWSNFVMTNCAVANVGMWDEDIFPAYYEDDDFRDRIRYLLGTWSDVIGDPDRHRDVPQYLMDDSHLIRYLTDRHIAVAHGPLAADTYLSGTHETMQQVTDEEEELEKASFFEWLWLKLFAPEKPQNPLQYESHRWNIVKEVSNGEGFFRCKHGAVPDAGKHGEDAVRYYGWNERFLRPFVNRTRVARWNESMLRPDEMEEPASADSHDISPWSRWTFNATRRKCVHEAANLILQMPPSEERTNLTQEYKALCSVC